VKTVSNCHNDIASVEVIWGLQANCTWHWGCTKRLPSLMVGEQQGCCAYMASCPLVSWRVNLMSMLTHEIRSDRSIAYFELCICYCMITWLLRRWRNQRNSSTLTSNIYLVQPTSRCSRSSAECYYWMCSSAWGNPQSWSLSWHCTACHKSTTLYLLT